MTLHDAEHAAHHSQQPGQTDHLAYAAAEWLERSPAAGRDSEGPLTFDQLGQMKGSNAAANSDCSNASSLQWGRSLPTSDTTGA
jgi:hypothetical protein